MSIYLKSILRRIGNSFHHMFLRLIVVPGTVALVFFSCTQKDSSFPGWIHKPVITHSQLGYHPDQKKVAVIEFDFSTVSDSGLYIIEYGKNRTLPFRIAKDIYKKAWQPALDVFSPVQMDHMFVNEAYRVWHGVSHLDDPLHARVNYQHFDLYAQGPATDTPFKPGEHIPGLNIGGWYDAGDFDIRTQSQYAVVLSLVKSREAFGLGRDETLGHAINSIIASDIKQYAHLGDCSTTTDNLIYNPDFKDRESDGKYSGLFDDRWTFTGKSSSLNYGYAAAMAASSSVLRIYNDKLADEFILTAEKVWVEEHNQMADTFRFGNTTGGPLE